ncbi:MAG: hypothetical protein RLN70_10840, partial [Rhodospirillaceae bacterium]
MSDSTQMPFQGANSPEKAREIQADEPLAAGVQEPAMAQPVGPNDRAVEDNKPLTSSKEPQPETARQARSRSLAQMRRDG